MMKNTLFFLMIGVLFLTGCESLSTQGEAKRWMTPNNKIKILCTIEMITDVVAQVGGEDVDTHTLIKGDLDPHSYQLVKGDGEKLQFADVVFYNGLGLEHGPSLRQALRSSSKAYGLGDRIHQEYPTHILTFGGVTDPHIWMDISLWSEIVPSIVEVLSQHLPEKREQLQERGKKVIGGMLDKHWEVKAILHTVPQEKRYLVTSHDAFNYFGRAYLAEEGESDWGVRVEAPEGLAPESQLSTQDIQEIIDHVTRYHVQVIFPESNVSRDSIRKIVDAGNELGLNLRIANVALYGDAMGPKGSDGDTYLKMIHHNAETLAECLGGMNP